MAAEAAPRTAPARYGKRPIERLFRKKPGVADLGRHLGSFIFGSPMPHLIIHIDGGSRGNPGPAAIGVIFLTPDGVEILTHGEYIGETTNNVAEYRALLESLRRAPLYLTKFPSPEVEIRSDSELLVKQMKGEYRVKNAGLIPLAVEARALVKKLGKVTFRHVYREDNDRADRLCNMAMNCKGVVEELD